MSVLGVRRDRTATRVQWSRLAAPSGARRGGLFSHGATGKATGYLFAGNREIPERLAQRHYQCLADDFAAAAGGTDAWGNDGVGDATTGSGKAALDALEAMGAVGPHDGIGFSMGCLNLLNIGKRAPTRLRRLVLTSPVLDPGDIHDNNRGGLATSIETAAGGAGSYAAWIDAHNPNHSAFRAAVIAAGWRILVLRSTDDPICLPAIADAWAAAVGATVISMGAQGHYTGPEYAETIADWLWAA